jgi:general secretion pathway protein A
MSTSTWVLVSLSFLSIVFLGAVLYHPIVDKIANIFANPADHQTQGIAQTEIIDSQAGHFSQEQESPDQIHSLATRPTGSASPAISLSAYLMNMDGRGSRQPALTHAMNLWKTNTEFIPYLQGIDDDQSYFRLSAKSSGLFIHRIETDIDFLKKLNLPAILEFYPPGSPNPGFLTLSQLNGDKITLQGRDETEWIVTNLEELEFYWSGVAYLPWKNFHSIWGTIPVQTYKDSVVTLKLLLQDLGFKDVAINDKYDGLAQDAVKSIQAKYGVPVDGYVGPLTKIILYKEKNSLEMPYLSKIGR